MEKHRYGGIERGHRDRARAQKCGDNERWNIQRETDDDRDKQTETETRVQMMA